MLSGSNSAPSSDKNSSGANDARATLERVPDAWGWAAAAGAWLVATVAGFLLRPPLWADGDAQQQFAFATFTASAVAGLLAVPMATWSARRHVWAWWCSGLLTLAAAVTMLGVYEWRRTAWSVPYEGELRVRGATYTPRALEYRERIANLESQPPTDERLLADNAGNAEELWVEAELRDRRFKLSILYAAANALFGAALITIAHALAVITRGKLRSADILLSDTHNDVKPAPSPASRGGAIRRKKRSGGDAGSVSIKVAADGFRDDAHAVVIGIDNYLDPAVPNLRFARADAEEIYRVLTDPLVGRFRPENVALLLDEDASERRIRSEIGTRLAKRSAPEHTVVVYFAGHGAPVIDPHSKAADGLEKYLLPHDVLADDLRASAIPMERVQQWFGWIAARQIVCFLDCCYSGGAGGRGFEPLGYSTRALLTDDFLDRLAGEGRLIVTACTASEVSLEASKFGHGLFTFRLIEGLRGAADMDKDGHVSVDELYDYVYQQVEADARAMGGRMNPVRKGETTGRVYLTSSPSTSTKA